MNRRIVGSILVIIFLGILFLIIGCGLFDNNSQPKIEPITDQTLDVGDETTVTPNITDVDVDDTHSVNAFSDNMNVAAVSVNDTSITITGKAAGVTTITVTAIDDSDQDNDTSIPVTFQVIVNEPPLEESYYDHIEGPWLWMIAPGGDIDDDNLSETSDGVITERQIALKGVNEGNHFDTLQWSSGRLLPTTVCGIFLCSSDNVINVVREIGLSNTYLAQYSAYALINIYSPSDQNDVLMGIGSDDSIKVWLNGTVVYKNDFNRRTTGIQNRFNVDLNRGNNLLLVKV